MSNGNKKHTFCRDCYEHFCKVSASSPLYLLRRRFFNTFLRTAKTLIRLGAQSLCWFCHVAAHINKTLNLGTQKYFWHSKFSEDIFKISALISKNLQLMEIKLHCCYDTFLHVIWRGSCYWIISVPTVIFLSFRTDRSGQIVQTQIRLLLEEQSDLLGAVWSGSTLFAIPPASFGLITLW